MEGADAQAYADGYTYKVVADGEVDYVKNIEAINLHVWNDANGNGAREPGEATWLRQIRLALQVNEVSESASNPGHDTSGNALSTHMHLAWAYGSASADGFDAATDVSAATSALMAQHARGVFVDTGAGNDTVTGSAWGDNFVTGTGINRLDGGANLGEDVGGYPARDTLDVYVADQAAADAVTVVALSAGVIAKILFFQATGMVRDAPVALGAVEAMQAAELLATNKKPTREQIVMHMDGNICRCGTYTRIVRAIERAAKEA